ncbi:neuronal acetylcholine receptor subunit alpha-4 isoform X2 [Nematostella vectensis]|nr:neuronal acetylcholine receptor subunit alpha-4 isoform X2 [Nematostella vectensis]XP_048579779.1 neuronal acetylcholine receptor subunit alpha-4 isoform X2 [Nematostella vectensis]XP_048579780.1 neuronal acetylcholine receptor subunit alpha-4 isoform X2 [Nematostella vectensis]
MEPALHAVTVSTCLLWLLSTGSCASPHKPASRLGDGYENKLLKDLFSNYNPSVRPVLKATSSVTVQLGVSLHQIIDLDERNQILISNLWVRQKWNNPLLTWDPTHFGNLTSINVDPLRVWRPDLILYNNADRDTDGALDRFYTKVQLKFDGSSLWLAPIIFKSTCKFDVAYFPFDEQSCILKFGSWTYDGLRLNIVPENGTDIGIDKFVSNGEWELTGVSANRNVMFYDCCVEPYPDVTFTLKIRRLTLFYYMNMLIPCFLITGLTLLSYILPPESGERITLVVTSLLAQTVYMLLVSEIMPPVAEVVPLISIYYTTAMFMVGLSLASTCVVLRCYYRQAHRTAMPLWLRYLIFDILFRLTGKLPSLSPTNTTPTNLGTHEQSHSKIVHGDSNKPKVGSQYNVACIDHKAGYPHLSTSSHCQNCKMAQHHLADRSVIYRGETIRTSPMEKDVQRIAEILKERDHIDSKLEDWKKAAVILDKFFLWVFLIVFVAATLAVFLAAPINRYY